MAGNTEAEAEMSWLQPLQDLLWANSSMQFQCFVMTALMQSSISEKLIVLQGLEGVQRYFAMARGFEDKLAMDMSKFFDTNYHYLVS